MRIRMRRRRIRSGLDRKLTLLLRAKPAVDEREAKLRRLSKPPIDVNFVKKMKIVDRLEHKH